MIIVFDYDGVIVDSKRVAFSLIKLFHQKYGTPDVQELTDVDKFFTTNFYTYLENNGLPHDKLPELFMDTQHYLAEHRSEIKVHEDIPETIQTLSETAQLYIVSSNVKDAIYATLAANDMDYFEEILDAEKGTRKIDKLNKLKKENPDTPIYFITDTTGDVKEAKKAGYKVIAVTWGYHTKQMLELVNPEYIAEKPQQLLNILQKS